MSYWSSERKLVQIKAKFHTKFNYKATYILRRFRQAGIKQLSPNNLHNLGVQTLLCILSLLRVAHLLLHLGHLLLENGHLYSGRAFLLAMLEATKIKLNYKSGINNGV